MNFIVTAIILRYVTLPPSMSKLKTLHVLFSFPWSVRPPQWTHSNLFLACLIVSFLPFWFWTRYFAPCSLPEAAPVPAPGLAAVSQSGSLILPDITALLTGLFLQTALVTHAFLHVFTLSLLHFTTLSMWWTPLIFKIELKPHSFYEASSALLIFLISIAPSAYLHCFLTLNDIVQFSCSFVSDSWWPHGLQHARPPCPSPTPGVYSNSCPLSQWCHPTISSSVIPFSRLHSFPASVLRIRWPKYWNFSFSISPSNEYSGLISLLSTELSRIFSNTTAQKHQFFMLSFLYSPTLTSIHDYWTNHNFD